MQNRALKICRCKFRPLNPPQCFYKLAFMHILSPRCCLQTLTKHIHLNCHTLHFCFPNCAIISHEWCSSLTQMPRNILHTEKLFKWAQINDGLSFFFFFVNPMCDSYACSYMTACVYVSLKGGQIDYFSLHIGLGCGIYLYIFLATHQWFNPGVFGTGTLLPHLALILSGEVTHV